MEISAIGVAKTDFPQKFGVPRQAGLVATQARIEIFPKFQPELSLQGLERYSHVWLLFHFHLVGFRGFSAKVAPPRLGGEKVGVFATRTPHRPNPLGLSAVKLLSVEQDHLMVEGADLVDGTPIFDIKPYLVEADALPEAQGDPRYESPLLEVKWHCSPPKELQRDIEQMLLQNPRSKVIRDIYKFSFSDWEIRARFVENEILIDECFQRNEPTGNKT